MSAQSQKARAAEAALDYIEDGMIVGLGSGSTAALFVKALGRRCAAGDLSIKGIPTSRETEQIALEAGVPLIPIEQADRIDVAVDGADEVDGGFRLIKGGGGCLLREKIIADAADYMIVLIDETKLVETLGAFPLPVEIDPFGWTITAKKVFDALRRAGVERPLVDIRRQGDRAEPFISDGGNYILDCACGAIEDAYSVDAELLAIPGVVDHGLFLGQARVVIVGEDDDVKVMEL